MPGSRFVFDSYGGGIVIQWEHHAVHAGIAFWLADAVALGNGETLDLLIETGAIEPHVEPIITTSAAATITMFEGVTATDGTPATIINRNRNSTNVALTTIKSAPTVTDTGTQLAKALTGAGQQVGGAIRAEYELKFKPNTKYLLRIANGAASNNVSYQIDFYEGDDHGA